MPERSTSTDSYRYAYNGMEMDNEVSGNGNSYTTEFRQYDARLGRWKSLDPLMAKYPDMSPYTAFNNNPIYYTDPYGLEGEPKGKTKYESGTTSGGSFCEGCDHTRPSTRSETGIGGMILNIPDSYNYESEYDFWGERTKKGSMMRINDFDGNGYIGNTEKGLVYKEAEKGQILSFIGQDKRKYTARFDNDGKFNGYYTGKGKSSEKYVNEKVTDRDIIERKLEQGLDFIGNSEYGDSPPSVKHVKNIYTMEFTIREETFDGEVSFNVASDWSGPIKSPTDLNYLFLSSHNKGDGGAGASSGGAGWQVKISAYVGGVYSLNEVITIIFRKKAEYVKFIKFMRDEFNIDDDTYYLTNKSAKPSLIIEGGL